ncbi:peptidoglycan DD-metalloendopeptidase family protein [Aureimonas psammosilenae]|uniref:peptidoglycan DD-metalloendopeptidase family protein n=1 Tax=Aureimonas psammosilenae TaxID=2495496 RepID=UPI001F37D29B|nr:peptidoglycan DD-metalloendopeptidase family protein [Aureimonas psammosilenae]
MRIEVLRSDRLRLVRTVAVVALTALGAACSADVSRFDDGFYTGALPNKPMPQAGIGRGSQPFPGSLDATRTGSVGAPQDPLYSGAAAQSVPSYPQSGMREASIQRSTLAPPSGGPAPYTPPAAAPVEQPRVAESAPLKAGWNKTGNTVTLRQGETLETLSSRYGVPVKAIVAANGLSSAADATPGQAIAIPTYSYGGTAGAAQTASAEGVRTLGTPPQTLRAPSQRMAASTPGRIAVEPGDTLFAVAKRAGVTVAELKAANNMTDDTVRLGQKLILPGGASEPRRVASLDPREGSETRSVVKPAAKAVTETAAKQQSLQPVTPKTAAVAAEKPAQPAHAKPVAEPAKTAAVETKPTAPAKQAPAKAEPVAPAAEAAPATPATTVETEAEKETAENAPKSTGIDQFRWPVQGRVIKRFGEKDGTRRSDGMNISVPRGTPVKAAENGVVIYAGDGLKEFGNTVLVRHDNGLVTVYGHADDLKVKRGEQVKRGQEIATAGMSGDASSPMLHFEVRKNSAPVDPGKYLQ